ncbi:MAG TPA: class I mannose-6-phosphate isomerase [Aequorivita sp.]|jgi:mannose-6-phosphate isomerase|nr:mannose-6-phosphate isomerase [Aequorivita sp.]MBP42572.1 mannose-6-phosphate isomerase [Aequorivita sp.]HBC05687.1 mannose-6-phosphate isomerase [Aequorivita sp.]HNP69218.1 class I mannose-6-phosphate isomerase [Aequorivita sp.]|tara:strand:+ start:6987 stop:7964 length:978 start_codon:yes stop_codon:yes gene_type:complete
MVTVSPLYPLKFQPILKQKVWGGNKLQELFQKNAEGNVGESWEISGVEENISEIANGPLKGNTLNWVLENYKEKLVGEKVFKNFGNHFPLLFKFIDAREDLSVQVHPDDLLAKARHNSFGKTEMWYILEVEKNGKLILGFNQQMDSKKYLHTLSEKRITEILNVEAIKKGDAFLLKPGTVHAIGAGVLLAEIQQSSDITYRIYDWDRPDTNGKLRDLHTDLALEAIDFNPPESKLNYSEVKNSPSPIGTTNFFAVNKLVLSENYLKDLEQVPSFTVYMCLEGSAVIETDDYSEEIKKGETFLIPAQIPELKFITNSASFLEVYIP